MQRFNIKIATGAECGQLPVAVTGISFGSNAEAGQYVSGTDADSTECRLGNFSCLQICNILISGGLIETGTRINKFNQTTFFAVCVRQKGSIGSREGVEELRELGRQVLEHARVLGALTGEKHRQCAI